MTEHAIRFFNVSKSFRRSPVLSDVSFEVSRGTFFGLVGVNGAGKTTLLKCMLDFCEMNGGNIEIFGTPHVNTHSRARLAFLPERLNPPYFLTGESFIRYTLKLQSLDYDEGRAERMLQALDLDTRALLVPVRSYSKGMTQKLGLAACFLANKELYVLDEPTSGLDPKARALFKAYLRELKGRDCTVFFTSHALADVAEICDRIALLHAGRVVYTGDPTDLCAQYGGADLEHAFLRCLETAS